MKKTLSLYDFQDEWQKWEDRKNTFSYDGKIALFNYLEEYEESTGEEIELDIIALCCDYTEYDNLADLQANYQDIGSVEDLENNTMVIRFEGKEDITINPFIIQNF